MINVKNIIIQLQREAQTTVSSLRLLMLSKCIQLLKLGKVSIVSEFSDLPSTNISTGDLYLVESEDTLYYRVDTVWTEIYTISPGPLTWGSNSDGKLGDNTETSRRSPVTVVGGITNWSQVSAGEEHCVGIANGVAYAWGNNTNGRLGDGTIIARSSPVIVLGSITNWEQVSGGNNHSLGVTDTGIAYGWGSNTNGGLGDDTTTARSSPVTVVGGITNWSQVSVGTLHSMGVTGTGLIYMWGRNSVGQLGDDTIINKSSPVTVLGGITNWAQVSAGDTHSLAITDTGIAYAWGSAVEGRLGDDSTIDKSSPVTVIGGITNWSQVSAGERHSLGVTDGGVAYAWGEALGGRLGDDSTIDKSSPVTVIGGITNWSQVSAGEDHSLGVTDTGVAYAWGVNNNGELGNDSVTSSRSPVTLAGELTDWTQVSAGKYFSVALYLPT